MLNERRLKLRAQFSDDDAYREHLRALCEAAGYNPYRSSYLIAITIAIWILLLMAIRLFAQADGGAEHAYALLPLPITDIPINSAFLWMDLTATDRIIVPAVTLAAGALKQIVWRIPCPEPQSRLRRIAEFWLIPIILAAVMVLVPSGLAVFVAVSGLIGSIQYKLVIRRVNGTPPATPPIPYTLAGGPSAR